MTAAPTPERRLLVWDLDGTLANSFAAILAAADRALYAHGYPLADEKRLRALIGLSLPTVLSRLIDGADKPTIDKLVATYQVAFGPASRVYTTLFPGVDSLLKDLAAADAWSMVATSKGRAAAESLLGWLGVARRFGLVLSADDVRCTKPHPEMLLAGCQVWGCPPEQALVIGDTVFDLEMGQRAGAQTCGVTWGNQTRDQLAAQQPTYLVDTVDELRLVLAPELDGVADHA